MNDEPNTPMIEALRDRKRQIELELHATQARLEEVTDLLTMLNSPQRRGRPRRQPPPITESEAETLRAFDELTDPPAPEPTPPQAWSHKPSAAP